MAKALKAKVLKFDAAGPGLSKTEILKVCEAENVRFMRLQFTDIFGVIKNVELPSSQFGEGPGRRDPVRRLLDRGIRAHRRVRHEPRSRTSTPSRSIPGRTGRREGRPPDLRRLHAGRHALHGLPPHDACKRQMDEASSARLHDGHRARRRSSSSSAATRTAIPSSTRTTRAPTST